MNSNLKYSVLIVGNGSIGNKHRVVVEKHPWVDQVHIMGQRDYDALPAGSVQETREQLQSMMGFSPDIAIMAGPATSHIATAVTLLDAGVHVLIEKPLSHSTQGLDALARSMDSSASKACVGYNLRFMPSLAFFKSTIDAGILGTVYSIRAQIGQYLPDWRPDTDYRQSVSANSTLGGGVLLELSHELDYLQWIFGPIQSVSAFVRKISDLDVDVEDLAQCLMSFSSESGHPELLGSLDMDFFRRDTTRSCLAIGQNGTLKWDAIANQVLHHSQDKNAWEVLYQGNDTSLASYELSFDSFLNAVKNNTEPAISIAEAKSVLHVIDAIRQSSQTGSLTTVNQI